MPRTYLGYTQDENAADLDQYRQLAINVKAAPYNAVGDGVTDDTAAIQRAIDAANAAGGGDVVVPEGTYALTAAVQLKSNVTLRGMGWGASRLVQGTLSENVIAALDTNTVSNAAVTDLRLSGAGVGGTQHGMRLDTVSRVAVERCWVDEASLHGIFALDSAFVHVRDCHISDWNGGLFSGVNYQTCTDSTVTGCEIHGGPWLGVNLEDCIECRVIDNTIYDNGHTGVNVYFQSERCIVANNTIRDLTGGSGIAVDGGLVDNVLDTLVIGNVIDDVPTRGISVRLATRTQVLGNAIRDARSSTEGGILVFNTAVDTLVQDNISEGNAAHGIRVSSDATRANVTGNLCRNNGERGIWVNTNHCTVSDNTCYLNGQIGIFVQAASCVVNGNHCLDNGQAADNTYDGINVSGNNNSVSGNWSGNTAAAGPQRYGINISGGTTNAVTGNATLNNETGAFNDAGTTTRRANNTFDERVQVGGDRGDAAATITVGTDATTQRWATTLTADRAVTLSTTSAYNGARFRIVRTGGGAFNLNVGTGPLKALAAGQWCDVTYDGSAWVLTAFGSL